ncbi:high molecular weight rhoptry protein 3, putative [Plasmodium vinckei vinckei]|uniref:High molecular weight rhoptry protein 3, putative n=1 Tax=Plasmodium vinckei vinckei TaxID=54757 RepID=A0A081IBD8_PLAVN|nr:high molecular weight rhoptry protein 3, putative [Plasmodium vinckei vinckei]KEG00996.1 hypothetical protein YYE_04029 [Plasmodium vinckei vinckei]VEV55073.1 high molecular weight rhoptry protein 3, putative [Plasmodium vinckei vinckei]
MPTNSLTKIFLVSLSTFSVSQVWGKEYFNGVLNQNLTDLLQCNFISYYNSKPDGANADAFLDFVEEPEQFYWFVDNYLSVPFAVPKHLSANSDHNWKPCLKRKWMNEFLKEYEKPDISYLANVLDKEQRIYYKNTFGDKEPVAKYTYFEIKEFDSHCILPPFVQTNLRNRHPDHYGEMFSFQMDRKDYQLYLEKMDNKMSAMKHLYENMESSEKQKVVKEIIESKDENSFELVCPSHYIKMHYNTECKANRNILTCIDEHIKSKCLDELKDDDNPTICDYLSDLFNHLKDLQIENFQKFLTSDELRLTKPKGKWVDPLFLLHNKKDYLNPKITILPDQFKKFNPANSLYFSFSAEIPEKYSYVDYTPMNFNLNKYSSSVFDAFQSIFSVFKKKGPSIPPVSVKELSSKIEDFDFKTAKGPVKCSYVKKSLDLTIEVDIFKVAGVENICNIIDKYALTKDSDFNKKPKEKKMQNLDQIEKGFHIDCILISTHIEAYNLIRQFLNLENVLSLIRYTSLYTHKYLKSVTSLKGNFLYDNPNAIKYAGSCGNAVLYIPAVLYRRNLYVPETFLSLSLGLSNLVSSNPSSPFFEYSIIEFLVKYFNKGTAKFLYYFISIVSILHINRYYYEQIYCHHNKHFDALKSKMIHPDIVESILNKLKSLLSAPRYAKMMELYKNLESDTLFNYNEMVKILMKFDEFAQNKDVQEKAQKKIDEEEKPEVNSLEEMAKYNEEWLSKLTNLTPEQDPRNKPNPRVRFNEHVRSDDNLTMVDRDKELELRLFKFIGNVYRDKSASSTGNKTNLAYDERVKPTDAEEMKAASNDHLSTLDTEHTNNNNPQDFYTNEEEQTTAPETDNDEDPNLL